MYLRRFRNARTGESCLGYLQGNGGIAVPLRAILDEVERVRAGRSGSARFPEPTPDHVKIWLAGSGSLEHGDPRAFTSMPLRDLEVEPVEEVVNV
jgi:hypothetical protein